MYHFLLLKCISALLLLLVCEKKCIFASKLGEFVIFT